MIKTENKAKKQLKEKDIRILVIEDSEDDALLQMRKIQKEGYNPDYKIVKSIPDLKSALEEETWDIILSDYNLPGFTGMDAYREFKSYKIDIPFIMISGKIGEETAVEAMRQGIQDYIMKDNLSRLIPAIEREVKEASLRKTKKETESELKIERRKFESLINKTPLGFAILENEGKILFLNPAAIEMFGYSNQELPTIEHFIKKLFPDKQNRDWVSSYYNNIFDPSESATDIKFPPVTSKDGSIKYIKVKSGQLDDKSYYLEIEDITIEKLATQTLEENQKRLTQIIQTINDGIIEIKKNKNDDFVIISANVAFFESSGLNFDMVYGAPVEKVFKGSEKFMFNLRQVVKSHESINWEEELTFDKKKVIWDIYLSPIFDKKNNLLRIVCSANDITQRKKNEYLLRESEAKFRSIASSVSDAIWEWDIKEDIIWWNEGLQSIFGYSKNDVKNNIEWWKKKIHRFDLDRINTNMEQVFHDNKTKWQDHFQFLCSDGSYKHVDNKATIIYDEAGEPEKLIGAMIDETTRKKQDELRLQSLIEGADSERKNLARELHDSLGQILTLSHIKLKSILEDENKFAKKNIEEIEELVANSIRMTRSLSHNLIPKALNDFGLIPSLQNLIDNISQNSDINFQFNYNCAENQRYQGKVEVNVYRIIQEALNNTLKHAEASNVTIQLMHYDNLLTVMIEDNGKGFDNRKISRNPGIGIMNIRNRVSYINGEVDISSRPGKGTLINLELPV